MKSVGKSDLMMVFVSTPMMPSFPGANVMRIKGVGKAWDCNGTGDDGEKRNIRVGVDTMNFCVDVEDLGFQVGVWSNTFPRDLSVGSLSFSEMGNTTHADHSSLNFSKSQTAIRFSPLDLTFPFRETCSNNAIK